MAEQKYIDLAIEYAQDDAKYQFAPSQEESLDAEYQQTKKKSPSMTYERWLQQIALFARRDNRAYQREKYYAETSAEYDKAYIAAIVRIDAQKFPKE